MVKSSKTGRELTTARGSKAPEWVRRFFAIFGVRQPNFGGETDDDSDA